MYDSDLADVEEVGWDRFVTDAWTKIFMGYRSLTGIRALGRRWSDLLQAGLHCPPEVADELVRAEVVMRQDRDLMSIRDPDQLLTAMDEVLADMAADLAELAEVAPAERDRLLASHRDLRAFLRASFLAADEDRAGR
ncbi:MAG: hypothetical protein ACRDOK_03860 [Streptosporangiaceae bacterium]